MRLFEAFQDSLHRIELCGAPLLSPFAGMTAKAAAPKTLLPHSMQRAAQSNRNRSLTLTFAALLLATCIANAHDLEITATIAGNEVQGKVFYPSGESANYTEVKAFDHDGKILTETKTDGQGRFSVPTPNDFPVTITAETEDGHRDEIRLDLPEHHAAPHAESEHSHTHSDEISEERVRAIVQEELRPLHEQLAEQSSRTRARDIFGGIGYIVGVFGLIVLLKRSSGKRA